jgi:hypothetical protein
MERQNSKKKKKKKKKTQSSHEIYHLETSQLDRQLDTTISNMKTD